MPPAMVEPAVVRPRISPPASSIGNFAALNTALKGNNITLPIALKTFPNWVSAADAILSFIARPISANGPMIFFLRLPATLCKVLPIWYLIGSITPSRARTSIPLALPSLSLPNRNSLILSPIPIAESALPAMAPIKRPKGPPNNPTPANAPTDAPSNLRLVLATPLPSPLSP